MSSGNGSMCVCEFLEGSSANKKSFSSFPFAGDSCGSTCRRRSCLREEFCLIPLSRKRAAHGSIYCEYVRLGARADLFVVDAEECICIAPAKARQQS